MQVEFGTFSKRRNSTKQPVSLSDVKQVNLKKPTSEDAPVFEITGDHFDYNYAKWGNNYYFVNDIISLHNGLCEIHCVLDVLATYKAEIQASTQFVCYSSLSGGTWLPDMRIPVLKETQTSRSVTSMAGLFNTTGFYVLSCIGKEGAVAYAMDKSTLDRMIDRINDWSDDLIDDLMTGNYPWGGSGSVTYDFTTTELAIESLAKMSSMTGIVGNAYANAPSCIRSCIWVPFIASDFADAGADLYLGSFDTGLHPFTLKASPVHNTISVNIPWHYSDWRRGVCEDVYLYLPLVGMIQLSATSLTNVSSISIKYSATATDGCVCYEVSAGGNVIGTYGGNCSANYPIGINQQASAGEMAQSVLNMADKMVSAGINGKTVAGKVAGVALEGVVGAYDVANVANTHHVSCVGGIGGGAGSGLSLDAMCYTVAHPTVIVPSAMQATMGVPTMQPVALSSLSGYCQCANAHVEAAAHAEVLDAIDAYLNNGFYIE